MGAEHEPSWTPGAAKTYSPLWSGIVPALIAIAGLVILDTRHDLNIIGFFALVPFVTALSGNVSTTAIVAAMAVAVVGVSFIWTKGTEDYEALDFWVRYGLEIVGCGFSCYLAAVIGRNHRATERAEILDRVALSGEERPTLAGTLERISDLVVPRLADICLIDSLAGERIERIAARASGPRRAEVETRLFARRPSAALDVAFGTSPAEPVVKQVVSEAEIAELAQSSDDLAFLRSLGVRSYIAVELRSRGRRIGAVTFVRAWSGRTFDDDDVAFSRVLADRFALALDNAGLFSDLESVEMRMDAVMEVLGEPVTITERGGRLVFANGAAVALAGRDALAELLDSDGEGSGFDIYDEDDGVLARDALPWQLEGMEGNEIVRMVDRATGVDTWLRLRSRPMMALDDRPMYTVTAFEDVTEMKYADFAQSVFASTAELLDASTDPQVLLQRLAGLLTPRLADACGVMVPDDHGMLRLAALADVEPDRESRLRELVEAIPLDPARPGMEAMIGSAEPIVHDTARPDCWPEAAAVIAAGMRAHGIGTVMTQPLRVGRRLIGLIGFANRAERRPFTPLEQRVALRISERVALAVDNARAASRRSEIAATLQSGLRPATMPAIPGWSLAALYSPAGEENEAGGDFYDLVPIDGGWMAVIADVTGHGARAASLTALARYTLRTVATLTGDPRRALAILNDALLERADGALCSAVLLVFDDSDTGIVTVAVAGHPPPLLFRRGVVRTISPSGPILGAFDEPRWEVETIELALGDQLVLYTDGIVEARGRDGRFGDERLRRCIDDAGAPSVTIERISAELDRFAGDALSDDAAAVVVMRSGSRKLAGSRSSGDEGAVSPR